MEKYDAIVVGTGGVGSAALYHLASRGVRVLGLDQFSQAHSHGSSHGQSRIIRQAYFEHPDYVPLLLDAYRLWEDVERQSQRKLFHQVGLLEVGPSDGVLIPGVMQSVTQHHLPIEELDPRRASERFPFSVSADVSVVFEPTAGYLLVEDCVQTHLDLASELGADWRQQEVVQWKANTGSVEVHTKSESYEADQLLICGGAWSQSLLSEIGVPLRILSKHQYWFEADDVARDLPTFFFETSDGCFYGFPSIADEEEAQVGMKVARHSGGTFHDEPVELEHLTDSEDEAATRAFIAKHLPFCGERLLRQQACMYTVSPDEHFIIDRHPNLDRVVFAAGLSGHGFKFTSVLGRVLTDLALRTSEKPQTDFLGLSRFDS